MIAVGTSRFGSSGSYYFESFPICVVLGMHGLLRVMTVAGNASKWHTLVFGTVISSAAVSTAIDISRFSQLQGRLTLDFSSTHIAECKKVAEFLSAAPKPAFCSQSMLAYPWLTQYPTLVLDDYSSVHRPALAKGLLQGGPAQMVRDGYFATLVFNVNSECLPWMDTTNYRSAYLNSNYLAFERVEPPANATH